MKQQLENKLVLQVSAKSSPFLYKLSLFSMLPKNYCLIQSGITKKINYINQNIFVQEMQYEKQRGTNLCVGKLQTFPYNKSRTVLSLR